MLLLAACRRNIPKPRLYRRFSLKKPEGEYEVKIFNTLESDFQPTSLEVRDISGGCGSMFAIKIESSRFTGLTPVKQQKLVYQSLGEELPKWHGLQLRTSAPKKTG